MKITNILRRRAVLCLSFVFLFTLTAVSAAISPGNVKKWGYDGDRIIELQCENARVRLMFIEKDILMVEVFGEGINSEFPSFLTVVEPPPAALFVPKEDVGPIPIPLEITVPPNELPMKIDIEPFGLNVLGPKKENLISLAYEGIKWENDGTYELAFLKQKGDQYLGLGEPMPGIIGNIIPMNYNHQKRTIWNRHFPPADLGLPFFISPKGYALFIDNPWKAELDFNPAGQFKYSATGGPLRFYIFYGPDPYTILHRYTDIVGKNPMPPRWVTGYMQSRYGYKNEKDFRWLMENFRSRKLPCDVLIFDLDWFGAGRMGNFWWFNENFPEPEKFQKELEANGFKSVVITEPYIFLASDNYFDARFKKLFVKDKNRQAYNFTFWGRPSSLLDFTNPETQRWYGEKIKRVHDSGVDGWWTDLNEPEVDLPDMNFHLGPPEAAHNLIAFFMNKAIYDMYQEQLPNERAVMMSRSGFAGMHRFGASIWSGDVRASFQHLTNQIPTALSVGLSGFPIWNSDTGGFHGTPSPELYVRWFQFSAFNAIFRSHGNHSIREPFSFGDEAEKICRKYLELRYRLAPYLYTLFYEMHKTGAPIMRPTFMEFPGDKDRIELKGQFLYGKWMLIAPVTDEGAKDKTVFIPEGKWTNFWSDEIVEGAKKISVPVDLETMPIFIREGAIIPMGPVMQYTDEKPLDPLMLHYYPSDKPSEYILYEDDGGSREYERGEFSLTMINAEKRADGITINIAAPAGEFNGMLKKRTYEIIVHIVHNAQKPKSVSINGEKAQTWKFDDTKNLLVITTDQSGIKIDVM
ncbi:MAG: glycoside hydrolase family 31 protein [bacterium]